MYKLDLTKKVVATGFKPVPQTGEKVPVVETPLSNFVLQSLNRVGSFSEAGKVRGLLEKAETNKPFDATDEEMKVVFRIFQRTETKTMLVFADMTEELNENFNAVEYEQGLNSPVPAE